MRIEELTKSKLSDAPDRELHGLRLRFIQLWGKNFRYNEKQMSNSLNRSDFLDSYRLLINEMSKRGLPRSIIDIDRAAFRKVIRGIDVPALGDVVIVPDYISIGGSFVKSPKDANDIDIIIRDDGDDRDEGLELKLSRIIQTQINKDCHFVYARTGPHSSYIPLFDKVLRPKSNVQVVEIKENIGKNKIEKGSKLKLTLVGTGALDSPRKDECLLIERDKEKILIDAGPDIKIKDLPKLTGILVCDTKADYMSDAKRIGQFFGLIPQVKTIDRNGLKIEPFEVKHTKHKTYAYTIKADNKTIVYAPEFFRFPEKHISKADLAICEGSAWSKPIIFAGKIGGHAAVLDTYEKCQRLKVPVIFTHIGKPTEAHLDEAKEIGIMIGKDGQEITSFGKARIIALGRPFTPLKTAGGYGKLEFGDIDTLWKFWAKGYIPEPGIAVETKYDGYRVIIHKKNGNVKILSGDAKRDLSERLPDLDDEIKAIKEDCILDGELLFYKDTEKIERKDMATYLSPKFKDKFTAKIACFDCLWYDKEDLHEKSWQQRQEYLNKIFATLDERFLIRVKPTIAKSEDAFRAAVKKHSEEKYSEGAMLKSVDSKYPLTGSTSSWAKFKSFKEVRCQVVERRAKKDGGYIYTCEIADHTPIGKTYATKLKADKGDMLEVAVTEVKYDKETEAFSWDNPAVRSIKPRGTALTTIQQAKRLAALGRAKKNIEKSIDFKEDDKGKGVLQIHIMGIDEEEIERLKKDKEKIFAARRDMKKLESVLKNTIGEKGAHLDFRLLRSGDEAWRGGEIHIGNISGLSKIYRYKQGDKLRANWKSPRKGEREDEEAMVTGGMSWFKAGEKSIEIFNPGEPGATANKYAIMLQIDKYDFECNQQDRHAKKFKFKSTTNTKFFDGPWLFAYVPVTPAGKRGERVWMASKLKPEEQEKFEKFIPIFPISKQDEHICAGIVYEPGVTDAQGDMANEEEIRKAAYDFMENVQNFKVNHSGMPVKTKVLESYIAPTDFEISGQKIKKGSWMMITRILDEELWQKIKSGEITGYSMAGWAEAA